MSTESLMPFYHLILCYSLLLLPLIFPSIRVFSSELAVSVRWPKYWNFNTASVIPRTIQGWLALDWLAWSPCRPRDSHESSHSSKESNNNSRQDTNVNCGHNVDIMELPKRGSETLGVERELWSICSNVLVYWQKTTEFEYLLFKSLVQLFPRGCFV